MTPEQQEKYEQGKACFDQGKLNDALKCFLELTRDNSDRFADVHNQVGIIYHQKGIFQNAITNFEHALKINPSYTEAAINLSIVYNELGKYDEASKIFQMAVKTVSKARKIKDPYIEGRLANEHAQLGTAYRDNGEFEQAIETFQKAIEINQRHLPAVINLGITYYMMGFVDLALREWKNALAVDPENRDAKVYISLVSSARP